MVGEAAGAPTLPAEPQYRSVPGTANGADGVAANTRLASLPPPGPQVPHVTGFTPSGPPGTYLPATAAQPGSAFGPRGTLSAFQLPGDIPTSSTTSSGDNRSGNSKLPNSSVPVANGTGEASSGSGDDLENLVDLASHHLGCGLTSGDWSPDEQAQLEEALVRFPAERFPGLERTLQVAAQLSGKTARDVALRLSWMATQEQNKKRKVFDEATFKRRAAALPPRAASSSLPPVGRVAGGPATTATPSTGDGPAGGSNHAALTILPLMEQNYAILLQYKANMAAFKVVENTELLIRYRDNLLAVLQQLNGLPGGTGLGPLPVQLNLELANKFLPAMKPPMGGPHPAMMPMLPHMAFPGMPGGTMPGGVGMQGSAGMPGGGGMAGGVGMSGPGLQPGVSGMPPCGTAMQLGPSSMPLGGGGMQPGVNGVPGVGGAPGPSGQPASVGVPSGPMPANSGAQGNTSSGGGNGGNANGGMHVGTTMLANGAPGAGLPGSSMAGGGMPGPGGGSLTSGGVPAGGLPSSSSMHGMMSAGMAGMPGGAMPSGMPGGGLPGGLPGSGMQGGSSSATGPMPMPMPDPSTMFGPGGPLAGGPMGLPSPRMMPPHMAAMGMGAGPGGMGIGSGPGGMGTMSVPQGMLAGGPSLPPGAMMLPGLMHGLGMHSSGCLDAPNGSRSSGPHNASGAGAGSSAQPPGSNGLKLEVKSSKPEG